MSNVNTIQRVRKPYLRQFGKIIVNQFRLSYNIQMTVICLMYGSVDIMYNIPLKILIELFLRHASIFERKPFYSSGPNVRCHGPQPHHTAYNS